jgi:hypothetical protein
VQNDQLGKRALTLGAIIAAIVVGVVGYMRWTVDEPARAEVPSVAPSGSAAVPANTNVTSLPTIAAGESAISGSAATADPIAAAPPYPVKLDALRAQIPDNRYWSLGAPTSDPAVAKLRAARAEQDNRDLGRITANEATPEQIRTYYAERRAISKDYLELAELVLKQIDALPERDRGMFELSANLHRARLQQIDRDQTDALTRIQEK